MVKTWLFFLAAWISGERNPRVTDPVLFPICSNESDPKTPNQKPTGSTSDGECLDLKAYFVNSMVGLLVPLKGGIGSIWGPPEGKVYQWHFSCQLGDGLCHRSHLLGEPETTID